MSLPNVSLADHISKVCMTDATTKKLQENKLKLHKNLKSMNLLENCTKETSILPAIQKPMFLKPILKKLVRTHIKFHTMAH